MVVLETAKRANTFGCARRILRADSLAANKGVRVGDRDDDARTFGAEKESERKKIARGKP